MSNEKSHEEMLKLINQRLSVLGLDGQPGLVASAGYHEADAHGRPSRAVFLTSDGGVEYDCPLGAAWRVVQALPVGITNEDQLLWTALHAASQEGAT